MEIKPQSLYLTTPRNLTTKEEEEAVNITDILALEEELSEIDIREVLERETKTSNLTKNTKEK